MGALENNRDSKVSACASLFIGSQQQREIFLWFLGVLRSDLKNCYRMVQSVKSCLHV